MESCPLSIGARHPRMPLGPQVWESTRGRAELPPPREHPSVPTAPPLGIPSPPRSNQETKATSGVALPGGVADDHSAEGEAEAPHSPCPWAHSVSVPSGCLAGAEHAVECCEAQPTASGGEPHPAAREAWTPPLQVFQLAPAHVRPPPPLPAPIRMVSCYCSFVRAELAAGRQAPQWACPGGLPPWRPSFRFGLGYVTWAPTLGLISGALSPAPAKGLRSCSL